MKSKLLIAISALSVILALPLLAQGQGGGGGGGQWSGGTGSFDMEAMQKGMIDRAIEAIDTDDDGELSKEEFLVLASHERYSYLFEEADTEEESEDEDSESDEADEADEAESEGDEEEESDEEALTKLHEAKFAEADADDDGNLTADELIEFIDFEAAMENMRNRWQQGGGQRGQGGGQRPGGGSP